MSWNFPEWILPQKAVGFSVESYWERYNLQTSFQFDLNHPYIRETLSIQNGTYSLRNSITLNLKGNRWTKICELPKRLPDPGVNSPTSSPRTQRDKRDSFFPKSKRYCVVPPHRKLAQIHQLYIIYVSVCLSCHNTISQIGWLKWQKFIFSKFWG